MIERALRAIDRALRSFDLIPYLSFLIKIHPVGPSVLEYATLFLKNDFFWFPMVICTDISSFIKFTLYMYTYLAVAQSGTLALMIFLLSHFY